MPNMPHAPDAECDEEKDRFGNPLGGKSRLALYSAAELGPDLEYKMVWTTVQHKLITKHGAVDPLCYPVQTHMLTFMVWGFGQLCSSMRTPYNAANVVETDKPMKRGAGTTSRLRSRRQRRTCGRRSVSSPWATPSRARARRPLQPMLRLLHRISCFMGGGSNAQVPSSIHATETIGDVVQTDEVV